MTLRAALRNPAVRRRAAAIAVLAAVVTAACAERPSKNVTLAIVNGHVWTGDSVRPWAEAVAIADHEIIAVGTSDEIRRLIGEGKVIDAAGAMVTPGFIDSHVHFLGGGFGLAAVQLRDAKTKEEFIRRIADFAKTQPAGTWITRGDWDHTLWGGELPSRDWIDSVTPDHPVMVNRLDGHMVLVNTAAMKAAAVPETCRMLLVVRSYVTRRNGRRVCSRTTHPVSSTRPFRCRPMRSGHARSTPR